MQYGNDLTDTHTRTKPFLNIAVKLVSPTRSLYHIPVSPPAPPPPPGSSDTSVCWPLGQLALEWSDHSSVVWPPSPCSPRVQFWLFKGSRGGMRISYAYLCTSSTLPVTPRTSRKIWEENVRKTTKLAGEFCSTILKGMTIGSKYQDHENNVTEWLSLAILFQKLI